MEAGRAVMNHALALFAALVLLAVLLVAGIFVWRVKSDDYEAKHREPRPVRLPRQLTERWADFDEDGRTGW